MQAARGEMEVEEVDRDLGAMTTEEQRAAVMRDAPELAALLADLQSNLAEVRGRVGPLLTEVGVPCRALAATIWHERSGTSEVE